MSVRRGFTLIELVIALVLSTFVLVGIVGVTSQMIRYQMEGDKKSINTEYELMSLNSMIRELQGASTLYCPSFSGSTGCGSRTSSYLSGCVDYTLGVSISGGAGPADGVLSNVRSFYYCVWAAANTPTKTPWLLHYCQGKDCPMNPTATPSCPYPTPTCGNGTFEVVAQDIRLIGANAFYFQRADDVNGVQLLFQVGASTTSTSVLRSTTMQLVNSKVSLQRAFTSTLD